MSICLEVHTNIKLQSCMMEVLHTGLCALHYHLHQIKVYENKLLHMNMKYENKNSTAGKLAFIVFSR